MLILSPLKGGIEIQQGIPVFDSEQDWYSASKSLWMIFRAILLFYVSSIKTDRGVSWWLTI